MRHSRINCRRSRLHSSKSWFHFLLIFLMCIYLHIFVATQVLRTSKLKHFKLDLLTWLTKIYITASCGCTCRFTKIFWRRTCCYFQLLQKTNTQLLEHLEFALFATNNRYFIIKLNSPGLNFSTEILCCETYRFFILIIIFFFVVWKKSILNININQNLIISCNLF